MKAAERISKGALAVVLSVLMCALPLNVAAFDVETNTAEASEAQSQAGLAAASVQGINGSQASVTSANVVATGAAETAVAEDHVFNIDNTLELMDAFKYDINAKSNETFVINLTDDIVLLKPTDRFDTHGKKMFIGTDRLCVKNGNTVTILGHGHSIIYKNGSVNNLTIGTRNGNLILGAADGSDSLTLTFEGEGHALQALVDAGGGTLAVHEGVTLSNNNNFTAYAGGGISATNGAVVTMDGGLIENNTNGNITWGGGVNIDGATFNMIGGTIKGNSEAASSSYPGMGGGVALANHGTKSVFNMSGNAVIEGNTAEYGGGVYVGQNGTFNMSDNASIKNNTATLYGGGVYVAQGGTFTMGENNIIQGNTAEHGGGVMNFGTATVSNVYDNDANSSGADLYNNGTLTMEPVKAEWSLSKEQATSDPNGNNTSTDVPTDNKPDLPSISFMSLVETPSVVSTAATATAATVTATTATNPVNKTIDDWYYDGHRETGETDVDGNAVVDHSRWNANESTADTPQYLVNYVADGNPTTEVMGLKAAHGANTEAPDEDTVTVIWENEDGTVLYEMDNVEKNDVPAADEYNELSGNADPTEPDVDNKVHEFTGWTRVANTGDDEILYIANYVLRTKATPDNPEPKATDPDTNTPSDEPSKPESSDSSKKVSKSSESTSKASENNDATQSEKSEKDALPKTGDQLATIALGLGLIAAASFATVGLAARRNRKEH